LVHVHRPLPALHFFYLASPDLLFGMDAPIEKRNVMAVAMENKELARKGILMRKFGQEIIKAIAGKRIHGVAAVPGGMHKTLDAAEREYFLDGKEIPSIDTMMVWSLEVLQFIKAYHEKNKSLMGSFARFPSGHLGMVDTAGNLDFYDGNLRARSNHGLSIMTIAGPQPARQAQLSLTLIVPPTASD